MILTSLHSTLKISPILEEPEKSEQERKGGRYRKINCKETIAGFLSCCVQLS
jgi:hypothetical protein